MRIAEVGVVFGIISREVGDVNDFLSGEQGRKKMNHEVFISYANADRTVADSLVERIEETGVRCWIAPRDEVPGLRYGDVIDEAVEQATVVIVLFSRSALESEWVNREVELAAALHKTIVPVRVDDVALRGQMRLLLNNLHWIDLHADRAQGIRQVVASVLRFLPEKQHAEHIGNELKNFVAKNKSACKAAAMTGAIAFPALVPLVVAATMLGEKEQDDNDVAN